MKKVLKGKCQSCNVQSMETLVVFEATNEYPGNRFWLCWDCASLAEGDSIRDTVRSLHRDRPVRSD